MDQARQDESTDTHRRPQQDVEDHVVEATDSTFVGGLFRVSGVTPGSPRDKHDWQEIDYRDCDGQNTELQVVSLVKHFEFAREKNNENA